jgi:hypothetical protein
MKEVWVGFTIISMLFMFGYANYKLIRYMGITGFIFFLFVATSLFVLSHMVGTFFIRYMK